ncbi:MAG: DUF1559 domain-containing protein, partial [Planctomycetales bacterium]|nr:DUF1559 domain-containing protein [Planctomycetales bacterium]NIP70610.1 DUF1559 domain-containing protein [Planctomycetales bacterium]
PDYGPLGGSGVLIPNATLSLAAITDGTSNTMMVSEHSDFMIKTDGTQQDWRGSQPWGWAIGVKGTNIPPNFDMTPDRRAFNLTTIRYAVNQKEGWDGNKSTSGVGADGASNTPLNSAHPGGVMAVFGDGSVHSLSDSVALDVLGRLAVRDDGQFATGY